MQEYSYNVKCIVAYDGGNYQGFQIQHEDPTVELYLIESIAAITKENIKLYASGRTDKGVHARGQVFNFYTNLKVDEARFMYAINRGLPADIRIISLSYVPMDFHARFSATGKEYRYYIRFQNYDPFDVRYSYFKQNLDLKLMSEALTYFVGTHDFKGFCSAEVDKRKPTVKTITEASVSVKGDYYEFIFKGDGFLKYQIRRMMSMIIAIGEKKESKDAILKLYQTCDKQMHHKIAPGCGLYLYKVSYDA